MRFSIALAITLLGVARLAAAQPDTDQPPVPDQPKVITTPPPSPTPPPPPAAREDTDRPTELAFGLGVGYLFPTSLETPNVTSVRVRFPSGFQLEPRVIIGNTSNTASGGISTTNNTTEFGLASLARLPVITKHKIDFELIGALGFDVHRVNPDGDNNNTTTTTVGLSWGVGISYWFTPHWNLSFTATNPLIAYTSTSQENTSGTPDKMTTTSVGVVFQPVLSLMIHLYN